MVHKLPERKFTAIELLMILKTDKKKEDMTPEELKEFEDAEAFYLITDKSKTAIRILNAIAASIMDLPIEDEEIVEATPYYNADFHFPFLAEGICKDGSRYDLTFNKECTVCCFETTHPYEWEPNDKIKGLLRVIKKEIDKLLFNYKHLIVSEFSGTLRYDTREKLSDQFNEFAFEYAKTHCAVARKEDDGSVIDVPAYHTFDLEDVLITDKDNIEEILKKYKANMDNIHFIGDSETKSKESEA